MPPDTAVAPPPQLQLPAPADPSGAGSIDIGTDEGALSQASQMANAQPQAPAQPPATPLHSRIADGVLSAFSKSDGSAGGFLRSALAGGLAGLAAASNRPPGNVPRGAAALGGFGTGATAGFQQVEQQRQQALENKQKQTTLDQQATREKYLNAETQARTYADQIAANNSSEEGLEKRYKFAQEMGKGFAKDHKQVGTGVTEDELIAEGGPDQKYDHTQVSGYNVGEKEVMRDGKMIKVPVFDVYSNKPQENREIEVTPLMAQGLEEAGYHYKAGDKIDSKLLDSMGTGAMSSMTVKDLFENAAKKANLSEDEIKAATESGQDMAAMTPYVGAYMAKHPFDFFGAVEGLSQQKGSDGQPTKAAAAAQRTIDKIPADKMDQLRHERVEENIKQQEMQLKQSAGDKQAWNLEAGATGADYLKTLEQPKAAALTEAAEGRGNPVMMQNRKGELTPMGEAMMKAYPDYDIGKAKEYPKLVTEFVTGQTGKDLVSMGTAINHTRAAYDNTGPESFIPGSKENKRYNQDIGFVSEELGKYVKGGVATGGEVDKIEDGLKSYVPANRKAALENAAHIIDGRRTELEQKWKNGQVRPSYQPPMPTISSTAEANADYLKNGGPKMGATKTFPNGAVGVWDGHGYVAQPKANP